MALCFIPAHHIPALFGQLQGEASTESIRSLMDYMRKTWIVSTVWPPSAWSVYGLSIRTNNDVEGWHNILNKRGRPHMPFYMLITLLHDEERVVHLQVQLVNEEKLKRHQEKNIGNSRRKYSNIGVNMKMAHTVHFNFYVHALDYMDLCKFNYNFVYSEMLLLWCLSTVFYCMACFPHFEGDKK